MSEKRKVIIHMDEDLHAKVHVRADRDRRSMPAQVLYYMEIGLRHALLAERFDPASTTDYVESARDMMQRVIAERNVEVALSK